MRAQDRKVPIEQLPEAIEEILNAGPRAIGEIARALGYSIVAVRTRLEQLEIEQRAHRRRLVLKSWSGVLYLWHIGADVDAPTLLDATLAQNGLSREQQAIIPFQSTVRTFPAINRRDPLVAALFGSAHQASA